MGTRNLVSVKHEGEYKIANYGQWDGYPSGQGKKVLEYLAGWDKEKLINQLSKIRQPSEDEIKKAYKDAGGDGSGFVTMEVSDRFREKYPFIDRDLGADILAMVQDAPEGADLALINNRDFISERSCEFAYTIDLDENTLHATGHGGEKTYELDGLPSVRQLSNDLIDCSED